VKTTEKCSRQRKKFYAKLKAGYRNGCEFRKNQERKASFLHIS